LNTFSSPRQHVVGDRRRWRRCTLWCRCQGCLQGAYRAVERQPVRLQYLRCGAAPVSDNGGKHDCPVDVTPPAAARRSRGCLQNPADVLRNTEAHRRFGGIGVRLRKLSDDVSLESGDVDVACVEDRDGVTIVAKRRQDVLERNVQSSSAGRELRATRKRCAKIRRHGNLTKLSGSYAHDISNGQVGLCRTIKICQRKLAWQSLHKRRLQQCHGGVQTGIPLRPQTVSALRQESPSPCQTREFR